MKELFERAGSDLLAYCHQPRYRTAWIIGPPQSGKTTLARRLCAAHNWRYLNYTLDEGYFELLQDRLETYQPGDLLRDLRVWCSTQDRSIVLVDELDALLAIWSPDQRRLFATRASRLTDLPHGLILVSNFFEASVLAPLLPESDLPAYIYLPGVQQ